MLVRMLQGRVMEMGGCWCGIGLSRVWNNRDGEAGRVIGVFVVSAVVRMDAWKDT